MDRLEDLKNFILWIIKLFRSPISVYVIVSKNSIKVRNIDNSKSVSGISKDNFSSDRLLIADPMKAEKFTLSLVKQIIPAVDLRTRNLKVICHPMDSVLADLSPAEKMIFQDYAYHIGGRYVYILEDKKELTDKELIEKKYA